MFLTSTPSQSFGISTPSLLVSGEDLSSYETIQEYLSTYLFHSQKKTSSPLDGCSFWDTCSTNEFDLSSQRSLSSSSKPSRKRKQPSFEEINAGITFLKHGMKRVLLSSKCVPSSFEVVPSSSTDDIGSISSHVSIADRKQFDNGNLDEQLVFTQNDLKRPRITISLLKSVMDVEI